MQCRVSMSPVSPIAVLTHPSQPLDSLMRPWILWNLLAPDFRDWQLVIYLISCKNATNTMLVKQAEQLENECMNTKLQHKKMVLSPLYLDTLKSEGHNHTHMIFSVLVWCTPKFDSSSTVRRRRLELSWIFKLHSLTPIGINQFVWFLWALSRLPSTQ